MKLAKIESVYRPNLLVNGDFKIWQRGEAITIQGNGGKAYTADMWEIRNQRTSSAQMIHQKTDEGKGTGFGFPALGSMRIYQWFPIEEMRQYDGQYMTRVWSVNKQVYSETFLLNLSATDGTIEGDKWRAFYYLSNSDDVLNYAALYPGSIAYPHIAEDDATAYMRCNQKWLKIIDLYGAVVTSLNGGVTLLLNGSMFGVEGMDSRPSAGITKNTFIIYGNGKAISVNVNSVSVDNNLIVFTITSISINAFQFALNEHVYLILSCEPL